MPATAGSPAAPAPARAPAPWRPPAMRRACAAASPGLRSVPAGQVEPRVHGGDLVGVAVEHPGLDPVGDQARGGAGDAALGGLAPARMVDLRIDVGEEAV